MSYKSGYPTGDVWALIDPGWGDPFPVLDTIAPSPEEAKRAALLSPHVSLYSGATLMTVPPRPGSWERLLEHGYTLKRISLVLED